MYVVGLIFSKFQGLRGLLPVSLLHINTGHPYVATSRLKPLAAFISDTGSFSEKVLSYGTLPILQTYYTLCRLRHCHFVSVTCFSKARNGSIDSRQCVCVLCGIFEQASPGIVNIRNCFSS